MAYYKDLREYIDVLAKNGKLVRIKREINKDTELQPLVRWQFRGLPEKERKAFLFENTIDVKGKKYNTPVLIAAHAPSPAVYALGMMCEPDSIMKKWDVDKVAEHLEMSRSAVLRAKTRVLTRMREVRERMESDW